MSDVPSLNYQTVIKLMLNCILHFVVNFIIFFVSIFKINFLFIFSPQVKPIIVCFKICHISLKLLLLANPPPPPPPPPGLVCLFICLFFCSFVYLFVFLFLVSLRLPLEQTCSVYLNVDVGFFVTTIQFFSQITFTSIVK